ncbi:MAG: cupin domain-containing protein [Pseudomonadota bacterium]
MHIHADFTQTAVVRPGDVDWTPSPLDGVDRQMLDRIGGEVARATSIVRYAAGSHFGAHMHGGGEEFVVLEGIFSDEHRDYPAGSYVRNPIGTSHTPYSSDGCTIFVKLHQFDAGDTRQFHLDMHSLDLAPLPDGEGVSAAPLHRFGAEEVKLVRWEAGSSHPAHVHPGGSETLVLEGTLADEHGTYPAGTWMRQPPGSSHSPYSESGALIWVKTGHLSPEVLGDWAKAAA